MGLTGKEIRKSYGKKEVLCGAASISHWKNIKFTV